MKYRCLNCDTRLKLKTIRAHTKYRRNPQVITCPKCKVGYDRNFIVRSDPKLWEKCRHDKNFTIEERTNIMRIPMSLGLHPKLEKEKL